MSQTVRILKIALHIWIKVNACFANSVWVQSILFGKTEKKRNKKEICTYNFNVILSFFAIDDSAAPFVDDIWCYTTSHI